MRFTSFAVATVMTLMLLGVGSQPRVAVAKKLAVSKHTCVFTAHGSAAEKKLNAKGGTPGKPGGGGGGGGKESTCSKTFSQWNVGTILVYVDGTGGPLASTDFESYVDYALDEWACHSGVNFGTASTAAAADITVTWANLGNTGVLGQTLTSYYRGGGGIVSSDVEMNTSVNWTLGSTPTFTNGCIDDEGNDDTETAYDFLSVMIHELGHAVGIDHPNKKCQSRDSCYPVTMYSCTDSGEYMRRTLEAGDITSISTLYPSAP